MAENRALTSRIIRAGANPMKKSQRKFFLYAGIRPITELKNDWSNLSVESNFQRRVEFSASNSTLREATIVHMTDGIGQFQQ